MTLNRIAMFNHRYLFRPPERPPYLFSNGSTQGFQTMNPER
jgi:hypothetical protein